MAIRPEISLQTRVPDIGPAISNALINAQRIQGMEQQDVRGPLQNQLLQAQAQQAQGQAQRTITDNEILGVATFAQNVLPDLQSGNIEAAEAKFNAEMERRLNDNDPSNDIVEGFQEFQAAKQTGDFSRLIGAGTNAVNMAIQRGQLKPLAGATGLASAKTEILPDGSVVQALPSGDVQVRNPQGQVVTGQERSNVLKQSQQTGLDIKQAESDIAVTEARGKAEATNRASRISKVTGEMNDRNRAAKRGEINLSQAATLVEQATQGIEGVNKVRLAKLFPGIDVSNEAALSQSLTNLALDELQKFKGPTTDFEFGKTEEIAGTLGDSRTANRAKIASLRRANWFNQRETKQFQAHVKNGGDPDSFGFNFGEPMKTKKGVFTLKDIQDTAVANNISIDEALKRLNK